jgi:hypothetical protein
LFRSIFNISSSQRQRTKLMYKLPIPFCIAYAYLTCRYLIFQGIPLYMAQAFVSASSTKTVFCIGSRYIFQCNCKFKIHENHDLMKISGDAKVLSFSVRIIFKTDNKSYKIYRVQFYRKNIQYF